MLGDEHCGYRPRAPKNLWLRHQENILNDFRFSFAISIGYFLNNLQSTILIMEEECVLCEVGTEILYVVQMKIIFPRIKRIFLYIGCFGSTVST